MIRLLRSADPGAGEEEFYGTARTSFGADWFATLRRRIGYAADNFLFYGTGGLAYCVLFVSARYIPPNMMRIASQ
jgi:opacity protein-like surface antigen